MTRQETGNTLLNLEELPDKDVDLLAQELASRQIQLLLTSQSKASLKYAPFPMADLLKLHPQVLPVRLGRSMGAGGDVRAVKNEDGTEKFLITVSEYLAEYTPEAAYTTAHELAHILTGTTNGLLNYSQTERFCEEFASQLILPRSLIFLWLNQIDWQLTPDAIESACAYLQVPMYSFIKRLGQEKDLMTKIKKCILLGAKVYDIKGTDLELRVRYSATPGWISIPERTKLDKINPSIPESFFNTDFETQSRWTEVWAILKGKPEREILISTYLVTKPVNTSFPYGVVRGDYRNSKSILVVFNVPPRRQGVRIF